MLFDYRNPLTLTLARRITLLPSDEDAQELEWLDPDGGPTFGLVPIPPGAFAWRLEVDFDWPAGDQRSVVLSVPPSASGVGPDDLEHVAFLGTMTNDDDETYFSGGSRQFAGLHARHERYANNFTFAVQNTAAPDTEEPGAMTLVTAKLHVNQLA